MVSRTSKFLAFAFAAVVLPAGITAEPAKNAADVAKSAASQVAEQGQSLEAVLASGNFKTLTAALNAAGLTETLVTGGPFTIFAPTDEAFAKIPAEKLNALIADKDALTKVLTYHVVSGKVPAAEAIKLDGKAAKTLNGAELPIKVVDGKVTVGGATVTKADVQGGKSIVHVIDTVVLPPKEEKAEKKAEKSEKKSY